MTAFEKAQPRSVFHAAGRNAFMIGVPLHNNPYRELPFSKYWEQGFRDAKKRYYDNRTPEERAVRPAAVPADRPKTKPRGNGQRIADADTFAKGGKFRVQRFAPSKSFRPAPRSQA